MHIYSFDDIDEGRQAVKAAMAEAGCFGPEIEKLMAGQSSNKDMISSFINWKHQNCTYKLLACITKGLGAWMADVLELGDSALAEKPTVRKIFEPIDWMNDDEVVGLLKKYGTDDLEEIIDRVYEASDNLEKHQEFADIEIPDVDTEVLRRSEQVQHFLVQFTPKTEK